MNGMWTDEMENAATWREGCGMLHGRQGTISDLETQRNPEMMLMAGRYRALRPLGEGAMGSVWLAEDLKLDGRRVALKLLPAVLVGKQVAYRQVKQEALMSMKLSHPNIATVRAFEEDEGNPFLVMDYIEGTGLDDLLADRGALGEKEAVHLLKQVASALDYAHAQGVLHRDVKPGNVIAARNGKAYVLDFGIARELQATVSRVTGKVGSGTLLYMSPEQLHGKAPSASQDVYSFSAMAYECLSGQPPFSRGQVEWQIDHDSPEPLAEWLGSEGLRRGIMAGLSKDPALRPKTCTEVLGGCGGEVDAGEEEPGRGGAAAAGGREAAQAGDKAPRGEEKDAETPQDGADAGREAEEAAAAKGGEFRRRTRWGGAGREEMESWLALLDEAGVVTAGEASSCRRAIAGTMPGAVGKGLASVAGYFANWEMEKEDEEGAKLFAGRLIRTLCEAGAGAAYGAAECRSRELGKDEAEALRRFRVAVAGGRAEELEAVEAARTEEEAVRALDALALGWLEAYGRSNALGRGITRPIWVRISPDGQALATELRHVGERLRTPLQGALLRTLNAGLALGGRV